jgi:hypothetical protein
MQEWKRLQAEGYRTKGEVRSRHLQGLSMGTPKQHDKWGLPGDEVTRKHCRAYCCVCGSPVRVAIDEDDLTPVTLLSSAHCECSTGRRGYASKSVAVRFKPGDELSNLAAVVYKSWEENR